MPRLGIFSPKLLPPQGPNGPATTQNNNRTGPGRDSQVTGRQGPLLPRWTACPWPLDPCAPPLFSVLVLPPIGPCPGPPCHSSRDPLHHNHPIGRPPSGAFACSVSLKMSSFSDCANLDPTFSRKSSRTTAPLFPPLPEAQLPGSSPFCGCRPLPGPRQAAHFWGFSCS